MRWAAIESTSFKKTDEGYVFYPWGVLVSGYIVNDEKKAEIANFLRQFFAIAMILAVPIIAALSYSWSSIVLGLGIAVFVALFFYYQLRIARLTADLPRSRVRLTFSDTQRVFADSSSLANLYFLVAIGTVFTLAGAVLILTSVRNGDAKGLWLGIAVIIFFGGGLFWFLRLIQLKQGHRW